MSQYNPIYSYIDVIYIHTHIHICVCVFFITVYRLLVERSYRIPRNTLKWENNASVGAPSLMSRARLPLFPAAVDTNITEFLWNNYISTVYVHRWKFNDAAAVAKAARERERLTMPDHFHLEHPLRCGASPGWKAHGAGRAGIALMTTAKKIPAKSRLSRVSDPTGFSEETRLAGRIYAGFSAS